MSRVTQDPNLERCGFAYGTITLSGAPFQCASATSRSPLLVLQPRWRRSPSGLGCSAFVRHY